MPTGTVMHEDNRSSRLHHNKRQRASRCREKRPTSRARTGWLTVYRLSIQPGWRTKATCRWMAETLPVKMLIRGAHRGKARTTDNTYPRRTIRSNFQQAVNAQLRFLSGWSKGNVVNGGDRRRDLATWNAEHFIRSFCLAFDCVSFLLQFSIKHLCSELLSLVFKVLNLELI